MGYQNPSTTNYACEDAWFIWQPTGERLCGAAIESDTIVFDGTKWRRADDGTIYLHRNIADKQLKAGDNGSFHVVIVDPQKDGQIATGILRIRYNRNGTPTTEDFGPMTVEVQARP